ncbi:group 1 truncated hemoglobin [Pseudomonadota bacterium]
MDTVKTKLFYALDGFDTLRKVHKIFYDKVYAHPWLAPYFEGHIQTFIEEQQTKFMAEKFGGPREFLGKEPKYAHEHMYITEELFEVRQQLLRESLLEAEIPGELIERWLKIDSAFKKAISNDDMDAFHAHYTFKKRIIIEKPELDEA